MAVSLNNLPADEVIGWEGRGTVSMPEEGKVRFANAAGTGFTALDRVSERFRGVSSGAAPISFDTEGDWGMHSNSTAGTVEVGYRGASAMDPFATSTEVLNVRDFKQAGDVSWSEAFQRCFDSVEDLSFGKRSGTIVIPYQSGGYTLHERVHITEYVVSQEFRLDIIGYGAMLNCTAGLGGIARSQRDPETMLFVPGIDIKARVAGISFSGTLDMDNLTPEEEFAQDLSYRVDHNLRPGLYSGVNGNGVVRQELPDGSSVAVYTVRSQSGIEWGGGYCDEFTDLQFYNLGCGISIFYTFASLMTNCTARDCLYGFYLKNNAGTLQPPNAALFNTMCENKCCRVLGKSSPITGTPFAFRMSDNHVFKYCSVKLDTGCAVPFNGDTNTFNVHTRARMDHLWIDVAGYYLAAVRTDRGADGMEYKVDNIICREHKGPLMVYCSPGGTGRDPHIRITNSSGLNFWETGGAYPVWDNATAYARGDRVSHTAGPTTGKTATGDVRYGYVAYTDPGVAGVNVPYPHYCDFGATDGSYVVGDKCYYKGKIYVATSNNAGGDSWVEADTATTISERAEGTYQGYVQLTFGSAHSYSVDHEVRLIGSAITWQVGDKTLNYNKECIVKEVIDTTDIVVDQLFTVPETSGAIRVQKRTTPLTDPYGYWDYDSDAVWAPQCQDVAITSWQNSDGNRGSNNFSMEQPSGKAIHIDGYYGTRPVEFSNYLVDTGAIAGVLVNGWNTTDGVWQSVGGTTIV